MKQPDTHFFLSSAATWVTTSPQRSIKEAMAMLDREGMPYSIWAVPVSHSADYDIRMYAPQVEGALFMAMIEPKARKR